MSDETFEIIDAIENELTSLKFAHTMLNEASYGLSPVINFDKSKEDKGRIQNLLNRREALSSFVDIATDYIIQAQKTLQEIVNKYSGGGYNLIAKRRAFPVERPLLLSDLISKRKDEFAARLFYIEKIKNEVIYE